MFLPYQSGHQWKFIYAKNFASQWHLKYIFFYSVFCRNEDVVAVELFDTSSDDIDINLNRILLLLPDEDMKPNLPKVHIRELKLNFFFEPRAETQTERFACQDSGRCQIFKLIVSIGEKILIKKKQHKCSSVTIS